jgi:pyrimidine operon attenuation protein/uracil phosphoribosyltransferase
MSDNTLVLNSQQVQRRVDRMAWEIYELNLEEKEIIIAGIAHRGYLLAEGIARRIREISPMEVKLVSIKLDKDHLIDTEVACSESLDMMIGKVVVLVDDVLNSGGTLIYGARYFLNTPLKKLMTAVLVARSHKRYPIQADVTGLSLATSMKEHVEVRIETEPYGVYLV